MGSGHKFGDNYLSLATTILDHFWITINFPVLE